MNLALILGVAVGVSAPGPKDPPKMDATIVGIWVLESILQGGKTPNVLAGAHYEFTADGQWILFREGVASKGPVREFKLDPKAIPATIDIADGPAAAAVMPGIYKLDGDTLTLCFGRDGERPKKF